MMNRATQLILSTIAITIFAIFLGAGCSFSTAKIENITITDKVDEKTQEAKGSKTTFQTDAGIIYASTKVKNAPSDTKVKGAWYKDSTLIGESEVTMSGTNFVGFKIEKKPFDAGDYTFKASIDGTDEKKETTFKVESLSAKDSSNGNSDTSKTDKNSDTTSGSDDDLDDGDTDDDSNLDDGDTGDGTNSDDGTDDSENPDNDTSFTNDTYSYKMDLGELSSLTKEKNISTTESHDAFLYCYDENASEDQESFLCDTGEIELFRILVMTPDEYAGYESGMVNGELWGQNDDYYFVFFHPQDMTSTAVDDWSAYYSEVKNTFQVIRWN